MDPLNNVQILFTEAKGSFQRIGSKLISPCDSIFQQVRVFIQDYTASLHARLFQNYKDYCINYKDSISLSFAPNLVERAHNFPFKWYGLNILASGNPIPRFQCFH